MTDKSYFHYTTSIENLISIIENGFFVKASLELNPFYNHLLRDFGVKYVSRENLIPMICLCEIPLTQIKNHMLIYGEYAIGMNKKWVRRNGFNPVLYYLESSELISMLYEKLKQEVEVKSNQFNFKTVLINSPFKIYNELIHFLKPYETDYYKKNGVIHKKYNFYKEHEWRYAPTKFNMMPTTGEQCKSDKTLISKINEKLLSEKKEFNISDVDYIFLKNQSDVVKLIEHFKFILPKNELELLKIKTISINKLIS